MADGQSNEAVAAVLDCHDQRRCRVIPTISVLVGPVRESQCLLAHWAASHSRLVVNVELEQADAEAIVIPWVNEPAMKYNLGTAAVYWLAQRLNRSTQALERSLRLMTTHELGMFLESCLPLEIGISVELVGRGLIEHVAMGTQPGGPDLAGSLDRLLEGHGRFWIRLYMAISELVDQDCLPVLVMSLAKVSVARLEAIVRLLAELATAQPRGGARPFG